MAFAMLILKARKINRRKLRLDIEKQNSMKQQIGVQPNYTLADKYEHAIINCRLRIRNFFARIFSFPKGSWLHRRSVMVQHSGTLENYLFKSFIGFVGGFFLIYLFFMFFVIILNFSLGTATLLCSIFGCILTIGLAFSENVRCIVFLILPQFFSKRGRQALLAYAVIVAMAGPAKNAANNMGILSESMACGQEQLKQAVKEIIDAIKKPFMAIKEAIKKVLVVLKDIVKKIKEIFLTIKRIVMAIANVIKSAFQFLGKIFNICSKKVGTPFQRCTKSFDGAITDCYAKLGPLFNWLCSILYVIQYVCYIVKPLDFICMLLDFLNTSIIGVIIRKVKKFIRHVRSTFYVRIRFSHSFSSETTASKSMKEITESIMAEIRERTSALNDVFNIVNSVTSLFFLIIILKAVDYRYKYLTNERFDNKYVTKSFRSIDFRRAQMGKESIIPLNSRERSKYVTITSIRLTKDEKKDFSKTLALLGMVVFKIGLYMGMDYSLYWLLATIRHFGKYSGTIQPPKVIGLNVAGDGFVAKLFRTVAKAFSPSGFRLKVDTVPCLPDPIPPDYDKYIQIGFVLFLCTITAIFEPYGLRIRCKVMDYYYPLRARERAVWLYNHILRNRTSFLKFIRRQLKRQFGSQNAADTRITCKEMLRSRVNIKFLRIMLCLGEDRQETCIVCAEVYHPGEGMLFVRCESPGCPGLYCEQCFKDLKNLCTICLDPIHYGDLSDIDEEKDSSEDETSLKFQRKSQQKLHKKNNNLSKETSGTDSENDDNENANILEDQQRLLGGYSYSYSTSNAEESDSGNSTEYSYSYQDNKNYELNTFPRSQFRDIELQHIPDYVSMNIFHDDYLSEETYSPNIASAKEGHINTSDNNDESQIESNDQLLRNRRTLNTIYSTDNSENAEDIVSVEDSKNSIYFSKQSIVKVKKWLAGKSMFQKTPVKKEKFIHLLNLRTYDKTISTLEQRNSSSEEEDEYSDRNPLLRPANDDSSESVSSSKKSYYFSNESKINTNTSQDLEVVPVLKLTSSSTKTEDVPIETLTDATNKLNYLFPKVSYSVESENNSPHSKSSKSFSSITQRRKQKMKRTERYSSLSSSPNFEAIKKYNDKVRSYYKNIPLQKFDTPKPKQKITQKQNLLSRILSRLF